jgi:purine-cytosine permease-like protein
VLWDVIVGFVQIVLVLFGMKWLERFYRYTAGLLVVCYLALMIYMLAHYTVRAPRQTIPMNWGSALTLVLTFSLLGWIYNISTTSRFAVPASRTPGWSRWWYFLAPSVGIMLSVLVMGIMGAYSKEATGNWNIALLGAHISGWGAIAAFGAALAVIHTNAMNLYPSTVALLVALNSYHKPRRWEQPVATALLGVVGTGLAIVGILSHVATLLSDASDLAVPFTFVMIVDWIYVQRRRTRADAFFDPPQTLRDRVVPSAIIAVIIGFAIGFWGNDFLPGFFYNVLPLPVVAGLVAAGVYAAAAMRAGHDTAADVVRSTVETLDATAARAKTNAPA